MILESGELDTRILIEVRSEKVDAGEILDEWSDMGEYWGKLQVLNNRNLEIGRGFAATVNYQAYIRYNAQITNDCRATIRNRVFNVSGVIHDPNRDWTQLFLSELTN